jgi:hypothetical protein
MRFHPLLAAPLCVALLSANARADADALNDHLGPREIGVGEAARADARGASSIALNPAGLALSRELVFEGGFGYRPGDDASVATVSACDSTVPVPGCFYYRYFKAQPSLAGMELTRRSHEAGAVMSRALAPRITVGVTTKWFDYNSDLDDEDDQRGWAVDAGAVVVASDILNVGLVGYNLLAADTPQYPRGIGSGISLRPSESLGISFDGLWNLDAADGEGGGRYGGGVEYYVRKDLQSGFPLRLGGVYDAGQSAGYITAGVGYMAAKVGLDIGLRKQLSGEQMDGTSELMIGASLRIFGPRMVPQAQQQQQYF